MDKTKHPGRYRQYFYYPGYFNSFDAPDLPSNWNTYIKRSVERDILFTEDESFCATFVKTGPVFFVGVIRDGKGILKKDFLRCGDGELSGHPFNPPSMIWHHLSLRASKSIDLMGALSEKQAKKSEEEVRKRFDDFKKSDLAGTLIEDLEQFGPRKR
ncbi:hypothetical protein Q4555_11365 [Octadecabacter sp. 1_MG-2023]|nr:hypothetical protein [Octadecabacter sp. B2R22]MDO6735268.1 hypothetical protein [Octadecabacter sp. 1_MG-2023]